MFIKFVLEYNTLKFITEEEYESLSLDNRNKKIFNMLDYQLNYIENDDDLLKKK
jgi:hypothetical protein